MRSRVVPQASHRKDLLHPSRAHTELLCHGVRKHPRHKRGLDGPNACGATGVGAAPGERDELPTELLSERRVGKRPDRLDKRMIGGGVQGHVELSVRGEGGEPEGGDPD